MRSTMSLYSVVLFLHIAGALGLFVALGLEWVTLRGLRTATTAEQAQAWLGASAPVRWLTIGAMTALLLPGMYMAATVWQGTPWIGLGLGGLVTMAILSIVPTGRRMAQISREVAREEGPLSL